MMFDTKPPECESVDAQIVRLGGYLLNYWPDEIEGGSIDTAIKLLERYRRPPAPEEPTHG